MATLPLSLDALNRLLKLEQPFDTSSTAVTTYSYDGVGNILKQESSSNVPGEAADTRVVEYEYDNCNQVVTAAMYAPEPNYTQYSYDAAGNLLRVYTGLHSKLTISGADSVSGSDSDYAVTKYAYDNRSRMIRMTDALGQTETYSYDKNGQVTSKTDRNGSTTSYSYNYMGQPVRTEVKNSDGTVTDTLTYSYAKTGALQSQSNGEHTTSYYYDAFGRVIEEVTDDQTIYNTFDTMGNRTEFLLYHGTKKIHTISYTYDSNGRMTRMSGKGVTASYAYDANGNRTSTTYGNGNTTTYTYNAANYPVSVVNKNGTTTLSSFHYVYALDGNVVSKTDHTGKVTEYSYDGMNRLTEEVQKENGALVQSYAYTFDDFNNRETLTADGEDAYTVAYSYDANNRLLEDVKTSAAETAKTLYFYDPNGNQIGRSMETQKTSANSESVSATDKVVSYEKSWYNGFNQMTGTKVDGIEAVYTYAPSGLRLSKTIGETTIDYALDGDYVAAELNGDTVTALYNRGVELAGSTIGSTTSYYLYNAHGDVVNLTNTSGAVTKTYEYDAFGNEVDPSGSDTNPYRYCGEYFDAETGRIYLRARYYDPVIGRMLAEDSLHDGTNWYIYCSDNPSGYVDPSGLLAQWIEDLPANMRGSSMGRWFVRATQSGTLDKFLQYSLGATKNSNGTYNNIYHIRQDWWQSIKVVGYNELYDAVFNWSTDMAVEKFNFVYQNTNFTIWTWKGDYINLGAGAEMGIYFGDGPHKFSGTDYAIPMTLKLDYRSSGQEYYQNIFYWAPNSPQWWINGFDSSLQNVNANDLKATFTLDFSGRPEMFDSFSSSNARRDSRWTFYSFNHSATFVFDERSN